MKLPVGLPLFQLILISCAYTYLVEATNLDVRPTILKYSGDEITITWKGVESPSSFDWLGIYMPSDSLDDKFIGYILLSTCLTWATGSCSLHIPLINMRAPYNFRIFKSVSSIENGSKSINTNLNRSKNETTSIPLDMEGNPLPIASKKLATSSLVEFSNYNDPTQIHLALTSNETSIRVMFVTKDPITSMVRFGSDKDDLEVSAIANFATYSQIEMCHEPAISIGWRDPGYIHNVVMKGLSYGTRYYYQVGSNEGGWSMVYSFIAPNPLADETFAFLFGDLGTHVPYLTYYYTESECQNTIKWLMRDLDDVGDKPSFISHIGDISYARGFSWIWDTFFHQIEPIASKVPYQVCIGNHEYDWPGQPFKPNGSSYNIDSGGECGVPYSKRFFMPGNSSLSSKKSFLKTTNLYYSINVGVVHFLFYSTETDFQQGSNQFSFIANDLRKVDRNKTPFVVFSGHRPLYTTDYQASLDSLALKLIHTFENLLTETKVNVVFCGHVHKYERMCHIKNYTCVDSTKEVKETPIYMVIGTGGATRQSIDNPLKGQSSVPIFPQPSWSKFRTFEWGYVRLHATKYLMTISYIGNHDGEIHDMVEIPSLKDSKVEAHIKPKKSSFDTKLPTSPYDIPQNNVIPFLFVFFIGFGLGMSSVIFYKRNQRMERPWELVNHEENSITIVHP